MVEQTNHSIDTLPTSFRMGNMVALPQPYNLHIDVFLNYGLKLTIDKELLKDCTRDIFVKPYTKEDELGAIDNLRSYLLISLKSKLCDELRGRMYMPDTAIEEVSMSTPTDVEDDYMGEERRKSKPSLVRRLLDRLSPRQHEALTLYYIGEKKHEDICEIMNMGYQSVRNLMHRGSTKLRGLAS